MSELGIDGKPKKRVLTPNPNHAIAAGQSGQALNGDLAADLHNDTTTAKILQDLQEQMASHDRYGRPQHPALRAAARQEFLQIRAGAQERANEHHNNALRAEETKIKAEAQIAEARAKEAAASAELERIGLDAERVQIEKAKVLVDALDRVGRNPELAKMLPGFVEQLGTKLLGVADTVTPAAARPALTVRDESA